MYKKCFVLIYCLVHEVWFSLVIPRRISLFALHAENIAKVVYFCKSKHKGLDKAFNRTEGKNNLCTGYQIKTDIKCKHLLVQTKARKFSWEGEETESGFIPKLHRNSWEENLVWNSHSICNLVPVPRLGHLGVDGRMFSLTCPWPRVSHPSAATVC